MNDPESGGFPPDAGATAERGARSGARAPQAALETGQPARAGEPTNAKSSRHAESHDQARSSARPDVGDARSDHPGRKKRRRKRGRRRKVYAEGAAAPTPAPVGRAPLPAPPAAAIAPQVPPAAARPHPDHRAVHDAPVYAALDLGTNNCRLLMAIPGRPGQFRVVDAFSRIVRLGEGLGATGRLGEAAMDRAVGALRVCAEKLEGRTVRRARLIATEACRAAANGAAFLERVRSEAGLDLEIIDRETEARLAVSGCGSLIERDTQGVVLFDIGGGSSEIALIDLSGRRSGRLANHIVAWTSLPVGVVSLAERFGGRDVTPGVFEAMVGDVEAMIARFDGRERLAHVASGTRFHLLGTSGTVTTLAGVYLDLDRYDRRRVDGLWMNADEVDRMTAKLLGWDFASRVANPCIGADRADLVLAGCAILEAIRRVWPARRLRVADRGLREGILTELMAEDGAWRWSRGGARGPGGKPR